MTSQAMSLSRMEWCLCDILLSVKSGCLKIQTSLDAAPNPFNPSITLSFAVETAGRAVLEVYDVNGRLVDRLVDAVKAVGEHAVRWDGRAADGRALPSGVYVARLSTADGTVSSKMSLVR